MLHREEILKILNDLNILGNDCWVTSGAALVLFGVKSKTRDIDLICTTEPANRLEAQGIPYRLSKRDNTRIFEVSEHVEVLENWHTEQVIEIDGIPIASLESIRKQKEELGREKDWADILLIDEFIKNGGIYPVTPDLRAYIEENILPLYEEHDPAHGPEHVRTVLANSFELIDGLDVNPNMVYTVAAYHDVGIRFGRKDHELTSGKWLWEDKELERWFTPEQRQIMREAVEDHRASRQEPPRNIYGCIVSEADRDLTPERIIQRCIEFGKANWPDWSDEEQIERTIEHVEDKYGEHGYLHLWMPCPHNEAGLATLREWLRTGEIREVCKKYL